MDTVLVRFNNDGPTLEGIHVYPKGAHVPVSTVRAHEIVACGDGVVVTHPVFAPIPKLPASKQRTAPATKHSIVGVIEVEHFDAATVGIVIPAYNPGEHLARCLKSLAASDAAAISEVVVVDDASNPPIHKEVAALMRELKLSGRVLRHDKNKEYAASVNAGAELVAGDHLLMLNVDIEATPTFLLPMLGELMSDDKIAVVGNLHRLANGKVDSAGSEWSWVSGTYQHRARDIVADEQQLAELDMTTWACCLVRRTVWDELGGLDAATYLAYWEDTEFCMSVRRLGYRIRYTPMSEIVHFGRHSSGKGRHQLSQESAHKFHRRWVSTGKVEGFARARGVKPDDTRIVVGMIALNEEEFIKASLDSIYADADKIVVVVGGVKLAQTVGMCNKDGAPTDTTMSILEAYPDPGNKLEIVKPCLYPTKHPMRDAVLSRCEKGDMVLMLDADEVMYPGAIWHLFADLRKFDVLMPKRQDIWNDLWTVGSGEVWDGVWEPRIYRFVPGLTYKDHHGLPTGLLSKVKLLDYSPWAHYAWVKPLNKLRLKFRYYLNHFMLKGAISPTWFDNVFLRWREDKQGVETGPGTHPHGGGATVPYTDRHPPQAERLILEGKIGGEGW